MFLYWELPNLTVYLIVKTETIGGYIESFNAFQENFLKNAYFHYLQGCQFSEHSAL